MHVIGETRSFIYLFTGHEVIPHFLFYAFLHKPQNHLKQSAKCLEGLFCITINQNLVALRLTSQWKVSCVLAAVNLFWLKVICVLFMLSLSPVIFILSSSYSHSSSLSLSLLIIIDSWKFEHVNYLNFVWTLTTTLLRLIFYSFYS